MPEADVILEALYHVPRSQVWEGSRGHQSGCVHLHVCDDELVIGRIRRTKGQSLCGKRGWWERHAEGERLCPRCEAIRDRMTADA